MISDLSASDPRWVGPYRLLGKVGAGGMGIVYLAASPADDVVALKLVRPELADDEEFRRRFKSEVAVVRRVGGVCTAKVRDADVDAHRPWVVTDFVAGPNLADLWPNEEVRLCLQFRALCPIAPTWMSLNVKPVLC